MRGDTAWWVQRAYGTTGRLEDGVFVTDYSSLPQLASWVLRQDGRAVPLEPEELRREVARCAPARARGPRGQGAAAGARVAEAQPSTASRSSASPGRSRPSASRCSRRCSPICSPRAARSKDAEIPADELLERFPSIPPEELEEHLSLLNLVNFGGGCYTIYTELSDGAVHVDKELWGDTFRAPPRLTPLEARAIRLALEYVGPMIAADAHTPARQACARSSRRRSASSSSAQAPEPHASARRRT